MRKSVILLDTEYTTWEGALESDWGEDWQHREIVQIAALKVDVDSLQALGTFDHLIKPAINPVLSDLFVELTGITNEDVEAQGLTFAKVYKELVGFSGSDTIWCYGGDGDVIAENCRLVGNPGWRKALEIETLHPYFQAQGVDTSKINSGKLARYFGVDIEIHEHNAMDDVYSIYAALKFLKEEGRDMPFSAPYVEEVL